MQPDNKFYSKEQILQKLETFCAYRERCEAEVKQKLFSLQVKNEDVDFYIQYLKENNFLNETRFAASFSRGKFNIKNWGKIKIKQALQVKQIDANKIQQSLEQIDTTDYLSKLKNLLIKKNKNIREEDENKRKQKLFAYALQKGYESTLIHQAIKEIKK